LGRPAKGILATVGIIHPEEGFQPLATGHTDNDGRVMEWILLETEDKHRLSDPIPVGGIYKIQFGTRRYFEALNQDSFFPTVEVVFTVEAGQHYHIPLLLSPFSYTTYRGS
jgi:5-hydroxyisourate hydrolase